MLSASLNKIFPSFLPIPQGYKIELSSKQMTMDFVNQSVLQPILQDPTEDLEKVDFGEKLGELNRQWQQAATDVGDRLQHLEQLQARYDEYEQALVQLQGWLREQEDRVQAYQLIGHGVAVRQTLKECKVSGLGDRFFVVDSLSCFSFHTLSIMV